MELFFPVGAVGGRGVTLAVVDGAAEPSTGFLPVLENEGLADRGLGFCIVALAGLLLVEL